MSKGERPAAATVTSCFSWTNLFETGRSNLYLTCLIPLCKNVLNDHSVRVRAFCLLSKRINFSIQIFDSLHVGEISTSQTNRIVPLFAISKGIIIFFYGSSRETHTGRSARFRNDF